MKKIGDMGREHVLKNYNFKDFEKQWQTTMKKIYDKYGSWENRKNYSPWTFREVV